MWTCSSCPGLLDYPDLVPDRRARHLPHCAIRRGRRSRSRASRAGHRHLRCDRAGDILLHHPYESFDPSVEHFIHQAADDPRTLAIKMTVYRVGDDTPFVRSLIRAAEAGKQVACVIELKARFDEARNMHWAQQLEKVGAHVDLRRPRPQDAHEDRAGRAAGRDGLALLRPPRHRQLSRQDGAPVHRRRPADGRSGDHGRRREPVSLPHRPLERPHFQKLLVAPVNMRHRFLEMIERESGAPARRADRPGSSRR